MNYLTEIIERAERAGFKMSDICREADIDQSQLSRWTAGTTVPLITSIDKLKHATDRLIAKRKALLGGLDND
jgi:transcriptional regulator with XRE-family HTH domain